jgi:hypothetical protein
LKDAYFIAPFLWLILLFRYPSWQNTKKLTTGEKAEKKRRQKECMTIFINGNQKRVKRPPTIDGMDVDEFINGNPWFRAVIARSEEIKVNFILDLELF